MTGPSEPETRDVLDSCYPAGHALVLGLMRRVLFRRLPGKHGWWEKQEARTPRSGMDLPEVP
jgi:hypothetical protein